MNRPSYKKMYEEEKKKVEVLSEWLVELEGRLAKSVFRRIWERILRMFK